MLDCWLNNTTTPTWKAIIKALGHMEQGRVADEIQKKHNVIISNTSTEGKASCSLSNPVILGPAIVVASSYVETYSHRYLHSRNEARVQ